jgi:hypothetical protein
MTDAVATAIIAAVPGILLGVVGVVGAFKNTSRVAKVETTMNGITAARVAGERYIGTLEGAIASSPSSSAIVAAAAAAPAIAPTVDASPMTQKS